jgi:hypothetical protein
LEQELSGLRLSLSQKDDELRAVKECLSQMQDSLLRAGNEKAAVEKAFSMEIAQVKALLEQKEGELQYWVEQRDNGRREEELLLRIEEDEAKIMVLEKLLGDVKDPLHLKDELREVEERLGDEKARRLECEGRHVELVKEKEEALDKLDHAHDEIFRLNDVLSQRDAQINDMKRLKW